MHFCFCTILGLSLKCQNSLLVYVQHFPVTLFTLLCFLQFYMETLVQNQCSYCSLSIFLFVFPRHQNFLYLSYLHLCICSRFMQFLLPGIWIQIFQIFKHDFANQASKAYHKRDKKEFLLASEAFQRTRVLRDLGSPGIQTWVCESISDCCACRVHIEPAHPMTLDTRCLVQGTDSQELFGPPTDMLKILNGLT